MGKRPAHILSLMLVAADLIVEIGLGSCSPTRAQSAVQIAAGSAPPECSAEFQPLVQRRLDMVNALSALRQPGTDDIEAGAACVLIRQLAAIDGELARFTTANRRKCAVPRSLLDQAKAMQTLDRELGQQACAKAGSATGEPAPSF
ncbi:hypothetical protein DYH55_04055 [Methylovirgula sp. 4M-Z18]|nr:hypothetical protein DYH55_04055 [Methylovirgula sp. 4M-Z18]